jgi:hypothetical protein
MKDKEYDLEFHGWGPCFHNGEEEAKIADWLEALPLCPTRHVYPLIHGGQLEDLIWLISIEFSGRVECYADQWVGIRCDGTLWKMGKEGDLIDYPNTNWTYSIFVESDSFLAGVAGCYAWLLWKQEEINQGLITK